MIILRNVTWWIGVCIFGLATAAVIAASTFDDFGKIFPWAIGIPIMAIAAMHTVDGMLHGLKVEVEEITAQGSGSLLYNRIKYFAWIAGLIILMSLFGHHIGVPVFVFVFMIANDEKLWIAGVSAFILWAFIYFILDATMHIHFPTPYLFQWLDL